MPVNDSDDRSGPPPEREKSIKDALQSRTDEPLPPRAEAIAEQDANRPNPVTPQGKRRRYLTRRNAFITAIGLGVAIVAFVLIGVLVYKLGFVDRYLVGQIKSDFAKYGVRAEIKDFHASVPPGTVEIQGIELFDAKSGEKLGKIDRMNVVIRIEDFYAFNLQRHVDLKDLKIEGLEVWVNFDNQGRSNFRNLQLPPPEPNKRILFAYSTAHVEINNSLIHYGDVQHSLSGEARNLNVTIDPDLPSAPAESAMNRIVMSLTNSTFVYDGRPVNNIDIQFKGRANQTRAEIQELVLRSPVAEARLEGTMDDWRDFRYQMKVTSNVDLTQLSDVLQAGTTLRGAGNFVGTVNGTGDNFKVDGTIKSDALAADNIRLQGLNVTAKGSVNGKTYDVNGKAIVALLSAGDFQLNSVQLAGNVMGTGSDFKWIGELRAAAERSYGTTITGLILQDARAEMNGGVLSASSTRFNAGGIAASGTRVSGISASDLKFRLEGKKTSGSVASVKTGEIVTADARVKSVTANQVVFAGEGGNTVVNIKEILVGGIKAKDAEVASFNIAGVRFSVRGGRVEGSTADITPGNVKLADGQLENLRLAKPVFVIEPSGRYRASADLSIGGGVLGQMKMGQAKAALVATSSQIQLNDFTADLFSGGIRGNATIALTKSGPSKVVASFEGLDVAAPLTVIAGTAPPLAGHATGKVDLAFPGMNFKEASGTISTQIVADTVDPQSERTPISGEISVRANRGRFDIDRVDLQTAASRLKASGQFSFDGDSNLLVDLNSIDASELQRVAISSGLLPDLEEQINQYGVELRGSLAFNGTVRGQLKSPDFDGKVSLGSLVVNGNDVGALSASLVANQTELRVVDGSLTERDGGGVKFSLIAPRIGENNISVEATLDRANAAVLLAVLPLNKDTKERFTDTQADVSGNISISGLPKAMHGSADLKMASGRIAGEPFDSIVARATFDGPKVNIENIDARLAAGHVTASGTFDNDTKLMDLQAAAQSVRLSHLGSLSGKPALQSLSGTADVTAHIIGNPFEKDFSSFQITFDANGKDVALNGRELGTLSLVGRTENKQLNVTFTTGAFGPSPQVVTARVDLSNEQLPATIEATFKGADLTKILALALPKASVNLSGRATGTIKASGNLLDEDGYLSLEGLRGTAEFSELSFRAEDISLSAVAPFVVSLSSSELVFDHAQLTGTGTNITLDGALAVAEGGKATLTVDGRLNLRVLNGLSPDLFLSGTADVAVRVSGTYSAPKIYGTASLNGASVAALVGNDRWQVSNIKSVLRFTADQAQIESFNGTLGGGRLTATGGALINGLELDRFLLNVHADNVTAPFPQDFSSTLDADVEIKGDANEQLISGVVNLIRSEYTRDIELADLINRRQESIEEGGEIAFVRTARFADLRVEGRNALVVRNNLADVIGSVSLQINGPVRDPVIAGRVTANSGTLTFRNDRYEITRAFMDLPPRRGADPILNIEAETEIRGYRVIVDLTGPLSQPNAAVHSEPALPQADVVSLITTGTLSSGDTSTSALAQSGLGTATSLLTDALINAPAQRATNRLFGLSRFEINPVIGGRAGANPGARLTLGKRISKELSVTYSTNVTSDPNQIISVEYRLSDRLSFVAQYEQASTQQLSSRNSNFNFEIRFRKRF
ncbi:MAG TPA: translocation/assembly module TamB domain-containing protein [Pyrinomonadaceae bacterium]|nr:translocation/assembly module TamB domain-containing protein [Pyrinomonadaceae bacterium]